MAVSQPAPASTVDLLGRSAWLFATVDHSEWCPAGNVWLDLRSGRYAYTAGVAQRICHQPGLERPVRTGRLPRGQLAAIRAAAARARTEGFIHPSCRGGPPRDEIDISNGGTPVLVLTNGTGTRSAPDDLNCWSEATSALCGWLDQAFQSAPAHVR